MTNIKNINNTNNELIIVFNGTPRIIEIPPNFYRLQKTNNLNPFRVLIETIRTVISEADFRIFTIDPVPVDITFGVNEFTDDLLINGFSLRSTSMAAGTFTIAPCKMTDNGSFLFGFHNIVGKPPALDHIIRGNYLMPFKTLYIRSRELTKNTKKFNQGLLNNINDCIGVVEFEQDFLKTFHNITNLTYAPNLTIETKNIDNIDIKITTQNGLDLSTLSQDNYDGSFLTLQISSEI